MIILETHLLIFHKLELADLDSLFALCHDPEIRHYFPRVC